VNHHIGLDPNDFPSANVITTALYERFSHEPVQVFIFSEACIGQRASPLLQAQTDLKHQRIGTELVPRLCMRGTTNDAIGY